MTGSSLPGAGPAAVADEFAALICADEQWLRAEFDAIVAAEWPGPATPTGGDAGPAPAPGPRVAPAPPATPVRHPGPGQRARQRSPPA